MADLHEPDVGTAYYRSNDPVKNLKLRFDITISKKIMIALISNE